MRGLVHLAILLIVAYLGYTQLWPRWRSFEESRAAEQRQQPNPSNSRACVSAAESVVDSFSSEIRQFPAPPIDPALWSAFMIQTSSRLTEADTICRCAGAACLSAATALLEQRKLLNQFDAVVRSTSSGIANPAASLEMIQNLLTRARTEAD